jgi:hypothetical protein
LGLVDLQQKIAARVDHGGSLADVRDEIIDPSSLGEDERAALWFYAATRPQIRRTARPLPRGAAGVR